MVTLVADPIALTALAIGAGDANYANPLAFTVVFPDVGLGRNLDVDLGNLSLRLDRISAAERIAGPDGRPTQRFQYLWQRHCESIEGAFNRLADAVIAIQAAYDAAAQASSAATEARSAATEVRETVIEVETKVEAIESGELNLPSINVGGTRFVNDGGVLAPIP